MSEVDFMADHDTWLGLSLTSPILLVCLHPALSLSFLGVMDETECDTIIHTFSMTLGSLEGVHQTRLDGEWQ